MWEKNRYVCQKWPFLSRCKSWTDATVLTYFQESCLGFSFSSWAPVWLQTESDPAVKWTKTTFNWRSTWKYTFGDLRAGSAPASMSAKHRPPLQTAAQTWPFLALSSSYDQCTGGVCERARQPARFHYARQERPLPARQLKPFQPVIWPACGADIGTHLHSKSSHLRCASLPTVLFSVVCLSLCLFVRCCI